MKPKSKCAQYVAMLVALVIVSTAYATPTAQKQEHQQDAPTSENGPSELELRYLMQALGDVDSPNLNDLEPYYDQEDDAEDQDEDNDSSLYNKRFTPLRGKRFTPLRGKRFTPLRGKRFTPLRGKRFTPLRGKRFTPLRGKRFTPLRGKRVFYELQD